MPYAGRGGAGNIQPATQEGQRIVADLEASQPAADAQSVNAPQGTEQQYAYKGRGGAGNYYSPKELKEQGTYRDTDLSKLSGNSAAPTSTPEQGNKTLGSETLRTYGRGGAGNYIFDASESQEKVLQRRLEEDEIKRARLKAEIEQGVESSLAMPPKAKLSGGRPD